MRFDKCLQEKCSHNPDNDSIPSGMQKDLMCAMCPVCSECGANQWEINEGCDNCLRCEHKEGYIRRGQPKPFIEIGVAETNDVEIVKGLVIDLKQPETGRNRR